MIGRSVDENSQNRQRALVKRIRRVLDTDREVPRKMLTGSSVAAWPVRCGFLSL